MLKKSKIIKTFITTIAIAMMVTPTTTFAKTKDYSDVKKSNVHYNSIMKLTEKGIVKAVSDGKFYPSKNVSRYELADIITASKKLSIPKDIDKALKQYKDVEKTSPYAKQIAAVSQKGILKAQSNHKFNGKKAITRKDMAAVLVKAFALNNAKTKTKVKSPADKNSRTLINLDITTKNYMSKPYKTVSRGQAATLVFKAMKIKVKTKKTEKYDPVETADVPEINKSNTVAYEPIKDASRPYMNRVYQEINKYRKAKGYRLLKRNPQIENIATVRAKDMALDGYIDHNTPTYGDTYKLLKDWEKWTTDDSQPLGIGETIIESTGNAKMDVEAWMNSPYHERILLNKTYMEVGVGVYTYKKETVSVVILQNNPIVKRNQHLFEDHD